MSRVSLVIVSHSAVLAEGVREVAKAMAPQVYVGVAGGTTTFQGEGLGTSFERIDTAIRSALEVSESAVVLTDIGSAALTAESVVEALGTDDVHIVDAPIVEGAVAAAVKSQLDGSLKDVVGAAVAAGRHFSDADVMVGGTSALDAAFVEAPEGSVAIAAGSARAVATVGHVGGLHARPAALIAGLAGTYRSFITIDGVDATSALEVMARNIKVGQTVIVEARGGDAVDAVVTVVKGIERPESLG